MKRRIHRSASAALALIALSLTGAMMQCPWVSLVVAIPDLEPNRIEGVRLWRAEDQTSQSYDEIGRIVLGDHFLEDGSELVEYTLLNTQNQPLEATSPALVRRGDDESGAATLYFVFADWTHPPGWIRVTTFNAVGESEFSEDAAFL